MGKWVDEQMGGLTNQVLAEVGKSRKLEARRSKSETNTNFQNTKVQNEGGNVADFGGF
jgi:hypothetical protein